MIFLDNCHQSFFNENGFIILPVLSDKICDDFIEIIEQCDDKPNKPFFISIELKNREKRIELQQKLTDILMQKSTIFDKVKQHFKIFSTSFISQTNEKKSGFDLHTDWSFFDQVKNNPVFIWIPLQDVSVAKNDSTMIVVPKSQKLTIPYRGEGINEDYIEKIKNNFEHKFLYLELKKGDAVFFNPSVIHGLLANNTNKHNFSLLSTMCETNAKIIYCKPPKFNILNKINVYEVQEIDDYYFVKTGMKNINCLSLYKTVKKAKTKYSIHEIQNILDN